MAIYKQTLINLAGRSFIHKKQPRTPKKGQVGYLDKQVWLQDVFKDFMIKNSGLVEKSGMKVGKRACNSDASVAIGSSYVGSDLSGLLGF